MISIPPEKFTPQQRKELRALMKLQKKKLAAADASRSGPGEGNLPSPPARDPEKAKRP